MKKARHGATTPNKAQEERVAILSRAAFKPHKKQGDVHRQQTADDDCGVKARTPRLRWTGRPRELTTRLVRKGMRTWRRGRALTSVPTERASIEVAATIKTVFQAALSTPKT